jgi:hypothetical protein
MVFVLRAYSEGHQESARSVNKTFILVTFLEVPTAACLSLEDREAKSSWIVGHDGETALI